MRIQEEYSLYIGQMVSAYLWHGKICPALNECRMLLPKDGSLYPSVDAAYHTLMTGEGGNIMEESSGGQCFLRRVLAEIETGEPRLILLHDVLVYSVETGRPCEDALQRIAGESVDWPIDNGWRSTSKKRMLSRKTGKKRVASMERIYTRLASLPEGRKKKKLRAVLVKELREEIAVWLLGMQVYTQTMGVTEALRRSQDLVHGFLRMQVRALRKSLAEGKDPMTLCRSFLSELELPEITSCMLVCFSRDGEGEILRGRENGRHVSWWRNNNIRKGVGAAVVVCLIGIMVVQGISAQEGKKENRLRHALTQALVTTVGEMPGVRETNQLLAGFMQQMLKQVDDDIDLTVKICDMNRQEQSVEVEAIGEYDSIPGGRRRIAVRRRLSF